MNKLTNILLSPFFIALFISIIIIILLPPIFNKYKAELVESGVVDKEGGRIYYHDLNNDNYSEKIVSFNNIRGNAAIKIYNHKNLLIGQWNFKGKFPERCVRVMFGDYDENGFEDIIVFTFKNDSVFINWIEPLNDKSISVNNRFITTINRVKGEIDFILQKGEFIDLNNDNNKEALFIIKAGFSLQPRNIFSYDIYNNLVSKSLVSGNYLDISDYISYNKEEILILTNSYAPNNISAKSDIPNKDNSSWLMLFNNNLEFVFEPIKFKGEYSSFGSCFFTIKDSIYILGFYESKSKNKPQNKLYIYNLKGRKIKERIFYKDNIENDYYLFSLKQNGNYKVFILDQNGNIYNINEKLKIKKVFKIKDIFYSEIIFLDIDYDKKEELIFYGKDKQKLIITRNDFSNPVILNIPVKFFSKYFCFSIRQNGNLSSNLLVQRDNHYFLFSYTKNMLYYFKYLIYLVIYFSILILVFLLQKTQKIKMEKRIASEKRIAELQLKTIKNQIGPHFIFNALNAMGTMFYKGNTELADKFFTSFSKLIRTTLQNSDKIAVTLQEEIDFTKNYIELQRIRYNCIFAYRINISDKINMQQEVPKMVIQTFVENAIKHGLRYRKNKGNLDISFISENKQLIINIEDNGIGREAAKKKSDFSTGKGLKIIEQIFKLYKTINKTSITYKINDCFEENGTPAGTKVEIRISN